MAQSLDSSSTYVKKQSVLPVRPQVEVVPSLSKRTRSGRKIVLQVENIDVIASMSKNIILNMKLQLFRFFCNFFRFMTIPVWLRFPLLNHTYFKDCLFV